MLKRIILMLLCLLFLLPLCAAAQEHENTKVTHYLLLGQDGYAENIVKDARTDTIVLVSLDEMYNRVIMTSVLRDSRIRNPNGTIQRPICCIATLALTVLSAVWKGN